MSNKKKLTNEQVVEIKRVLFGFDPKLSQVKLGEKYGVSRGVISDIKACKSYKDIEIDENGEYVNNVVEIVPENFPVPNIIDVEREREEKELKRIKAVADDENAIYKDEFLNNYFIKDGYTYEPASEISKNFIFGHKVWGRFNWLMNWERDEFMSVVMMSVVNTVVHYEPKKIDSDWSKINDAGAEESKSIHKYINQAIITDVGNHVNSVNDSYMTTENGISTWHTPEIDSVDAVVQNEEGSFPVIEEMGENMSVFHMKEHYSNSQFLDWFTQSYRGILSNIQVDFLNVLKFFQNERYDDYVMPYSRLPQEFKPYSQNYVGTTRREIRIKVEKEYLKVKPMTLFELKNERELGFWGQVSEIVNGELEGQNQKLGKWIRGNIDGEFMGKVLDEMGKSEILEIVNSENKISGKVLYRFVDLVGERVSELKEKGQ